MNPPQYVQEVRHSGRPLTGWRLQLYTIIFEADTRAGRTFDLALIVASVALVMLDGVAGYRERWGLLFDVLEWAFTLLFAVEYVARLSCVLHPGAALQAQP